MLRATMSSARRFGLSFCALLVPSVLGACEGAPAETSAATASAATPAGTWPFWGGDLHNTHFAASETSLSPANVAALTTKWHAASVGNVSAIPTVADGVAYVVDWGLPLVEGGSLRALDVATGRQLWSHAIVEYSGNLLNPTVRASPAVAGDLLVFGDVRSEVTSVLDIPGAQGATLYAVARSDGHLVWKTRLDANPLAVVTQSPVVVGGKVFVGVSSYEEFAARLAYPCCGFHGSMHAVDLATGHPLWRTQTTPDGFPGGSVWGSSPSVDLARNAVYVGTGNNYDFPNALERCLGAHRGDPAAQQTQCFDVLDRPDNFADSILALDLDTGAPHWSRKLRNWGSWTLACDGRLIPFLPRNPLNCRDLDSLDFDFGQAPMLVTVSVGGAPRDLLLVGQKSGTAWAFDPANAGATVWSMQVGPGGVLGGMEFGAATDGQRMYVQLTNFDHTPFTIAAGAHKGELVDGGAWSALDAATGAILWQTPDPASALPKFGPLFSPAWGGLLGDGFFGTAMGPLTVANGVVFAGSMDRAGHMYAFDAATGAILWSFASGGSVMSAPTIVNGVVLWGSGYKTGFDGQGFWAFALPH